MLRIWLMCVAGEVENAEERTERAKACPCPVHARRNRKSHKDRLNVSRWVLIRKSFSTKLSFMVRNWANSSCISMSRKSSVIIILYINVFGTLGKQWNFEGKLESMASEKYVDFSDSFLREGKPLKPKTLLFNIRVQQNQQHNHQTTSLIVESPFHCFWGKRKQNFFVKKIS